ncbi:hypothetical protein [Cellvibrio sp. PSBB006]|uniref:hypothetical protein n=1 Tax=Cellvibrio sp. PSBB006 TaxID=1987723 RepID=UPI000B3B9CC8|nr:hypothetical protein [Cellvibrio sp. PSBB006]ARU26755.1 hypothetical protein CBR65_04535 [Cellvibrio sp. PSBB006]
MKKLMLSAGFLAMALGASFSNAAVVTLGLHPACNGNGTLINPAYPWNGSTYRYCQLPSNIAVGNNTIELPVTVPFAGSTTPILWVLPQVVTVGNGQSATATPAGVDKTEIVIGAGAKVAGAIENSALVMTRGTKLTANGWDEVEQVIKPIIFSSLDNGFSGQGEWGGVILSGFGVSNQCNSGYVSANCTMEGISAGTYYFGGGADTNMSSGTLNYVVITEGGSVVDVDTDGDPDPNSNSGDEINGLTLYAVNDTTSINNVHIHDNLDDGIEFFGGDVDVSNLWLTCHKDDSVDWDHGYTGNLQNVQIIQKSGADHAFELASNPNDPDAPPRAHGTVTNASVTLLSGTADSPFSFKEGTDASLSNVVISGYSGIACNVAGTYHQVTTSDFSLIEYGCSNSTGLLPASNTSATGFTSASFWTTAQGNPGCN